MALRLAQAFVLDPVGVVLGALPGHIRMQVWRDTADDADPSWNENMHRLLGAPWPCPEAERLESLLSETTARLAASKDQRLAATLTARDSDSDASLGRAVWCAVRHTQSAVVVETGVARGVTSRIVLEALERMISRATLEHRPSAPLRSLTARRDRRRSHRRLASPLELCRGIQPATATGVAP